MAKETENFIPMDRLQDHYKHCIRLCASNKINPKNAFDLRLIDYMQDLVSITEGRQMNFKIASSALDVGAKIYSNRVDNIQSEAQKVASSILMALDGEQPECNNDSVASDRVADDVDEEEEEQKKSKKKRKIRNVKTIVEDKSLLDSKLEKMVLGDPFLDGLSQEYDMSCPAALISYNALTQPNGLLTIESANLRLNYREDTMIKPIVSLASLTLITKNLNCAKIIRENLNAQICPKLETFLFNDRTTKITANTSTQEFQPEEYGGGDDCHDDFVDDDSRNTIGAPEVQDYDAPLDLDKIAASKPSEYFYPNHRLINTWAGPHAWKIAKDAPLTAVKAKNPRKRAKLESKAPFDPKKEIDDDPVIGDRTIRNTSNALKKWKVFTIQDHNLNEEKAFVKLQHMRLSPQEINPIELESRLNSQPDENGHGQDGFAPPDSPVSQGYEDAHDGIDVHDSDDEFVADVSTDLEFAGEHLIEQPYTVAHVNIPFAKLAKKMDVRKLKRVMWDVLLPQQSHNNTVIQNGGDDISAEKPETPVNLEFSSLYGELPVRVNTKMANDLSQPIAFVTLLHLANEKNLKLIPREDLRDFVIEQD